MRSVWMSDAALLSGTDLLSGLPSVRYAYVTEPTLRTGTDLLTGVSSPFGVYESDVLTQLEVARPNGTLLQALFPEFSPQTQEDAWILDQYLGESDIRKAVPG